MTMIDEKRQLFVVFIVVFIGFAGTSMAYPIFPPLFLHPMVNSIIPMGWTNNARSISLGIALAAYPLGQFIGSPLLGGFSDHFGRKPILVFSLITSVLGYLLTGISLSFNILWLLLISRFLTGLMEGNFGIVRAIVADMETISKFKSLGQINAASSLGYIMGPLLGGFLADNSIAPYFSFALPFFIAAVFSVIALYLTVTKITEKKKSSQQTLQSIRQQFNFFKRFHTLLSKNVMLKRILLISTLFTFSVDIFYEFSPVYLTGLWSMTPAGIAVYTAILSLTLTIAHGWLTHYLSHYFSSRRIVMASILTTAIMMGLLALFPSKILAFILFGLAGISIALGVNNLTVQLSNTASKTIQGEVLGTQIGFRMLGDAFICMIGGFLIISSVITPIAISCCVGLMAGLLYRVCCNEV